jgi:hypothetical protein
MSFDLEQELKRTLHREDASRDFTDRVMARIASGGEKRKPARSENGWWERVRSFFQPSAMKWAPMKWAPMKWAVAGAAVFLFIFAAVCVHRYREGQRAAAEIAEGERAKEQVMLAMRIASAKLNLAQKKVAGSQ